MNTVRGKIGIYISNANIVFWGELEKRHCGLFECSTNPNNQKPNQNIRQVFWRETNWRSRWWRFMTSNMFKTLSVAIGCEQWGSVYESNEEISNRYQVSIPKLFYISVGVSLESAVERTSVSPPSGAEFSALGTSRQPGSYWTCMISNMILYLICFKYFVVN